MDTPHNSRSEEDRSPGSAVRCLPRANHGHAVSPHRTLAAVAGGLLLFGLLVAGCAHTEREAFVAVAPEPPPIFNGMIAVLLTNRDGFSAWLAVESSRMVGNVAPVAGQLFSRAGKLAFVPEPPKEKRVRAAGLSYVWDAATNSGFVLSEPLQGFAPYSVSSHVTNVTATGSTTPESVGGQACLREEVTLTASDGSAARVRIWRTVEDPALPVRIVSTTSDLTLTLSRLRRGTPPADLFSPPESFTKYSSAESMMTELALRQQNLRRPAPPAWREAEPLGTTEDNYRRQSR